LPIAEYNGQEAYVGESIFQHWIRWETGSDSSSWKSFGGLSRRAAKPGWTFAIHPRRTYGIHPLSVEDCLDEDQVPKIEDFPTNTFILRNGYHYQDGILGLEEVDFHTRKELPDYRVRASGRQFKTL